MPLPGLPSTLGKMAQYTLPRDRLRCPPPAGPDQGRRIGTGKEMRGAHLAMPANPPRFVLPQSRSHGSARYSCRAKQPLKCVHGREGEQQGRGGERATAATHTPLLLPRPLQATYCSQRPLGRRVQWRPRGGNNKSSAMKYVGRIHHKGLGLAADLAAVTEGFPHWTRRQPCSTPCMCRGTAPLPAPACTHHLPPSPLLR